jgi:catechol 2,3-dioxygenase-like lactoylglutathione lyase family enzyme
MTGDRPWTDFSAVVLDSPDAHQLCAFYQALLGWEIGTDEPDWVTLHPPGGGTGLSFAAEPDTYVRPTWPSDPGQQQMMLHLDIEVRDLDEGVRYALDAGAELAEFQPQPLVRVLLDPAGHPFCLWVRE